MSMIFLAAMLAAAPAPAPIVIGPGADSCGQWLEARRSDGPAQLAMHSWFAGYLSAANVAGAGDILRGGRVEDARLWVDRWCRDNPTRSVRQASDAFIEAHLER
jgi:hypothetical protein